MNEDQSPVDIASIKSATVLMRDSNGETREITRVPLREVFEIED